MKCCSEMLHYLMALWEKQGDYSKGQLKTPYEDCGVGVRGNHQVWSQADLGLDLSSATDGHEALNKTLDCSQPVSTEPKEHGVISKFRKLRVSQT